jgi:hypothetical protein
MDKQTLKPGAVKACQAMDKQTAFNMYSPTEVGAPYAQLAVVAAALRQARLPLERGDGQRDVAHRLVRAAQVRVGLHLRPDVPRRGVAVQVEFEKAKARNQDIACRQVPRVERVHRNSP